MLWKTHKKGHDTPLDHDQGQGKTLNVLDSQETILVTSYFFVIYMYMYVFICNT